MATKIIKLEQPNCTPCQIMDNILAEVEDVPVEKYDVTKNPEKGAQYGVMSVPVTIIEKDGVEVERFLGATPLDEITAVLEKL
jgi:thioredoxin 1